MVVVIGQEERKLPKPTLTGYSDPLWAAEPITISDWFQTPALLRQNLSHLLRYHHHPRRLPLMHQKADTLLLCTCRSCQCTLFIYSDRGLICCRTRLYNDSFQQKYNKLEGQDKHVTKSTLLWNKVAAMIISL